MAKTARYKRIRYMIPEGARILFVGINPHPGSYGRGVPFSNNKSFWYLLCDSGLIEKRREELSNDEALRRFYYEEFSQKSGLGFVNLVDRPTVDVAKLKKGEERKGVVRLLRMIKRRRPGLICFIGKITYAKFSGEKSVDYGFKEPIMGISAYVCRFPIRGPTEDRITELRMLRDYVLAQPGKRKRT